MSLLKFLVFMCSVVLCLSAIANRSSVDVSKIPLLSGRPSYDACDEYSKQFPTRLFPYLDINPFAVNGEFPHIVTIYVDDPDDETQVVLQCAGNIISPRYVLTVGHIPQWYKSLKVRAGTVSAAEVGSTGRIYECEEYIRFPRPLRKKSDDIGLIKTKDPIEFSLNVRPACLYSDPYDVDVIMSSPGWGAPNTGVKFLVKAEFSIVPKSDCNKIYTGIYFPEGLTTGMLCVIDKTGNSVHCSGDSGSPLQFLSSENGMFNIVGISSLGKGCNSNFPQIFTNITHYIDWIESIVWPGGSDEI